MTFQECRHHIIQNGIVTQEISPGVFAYGWDADFDLYPKEFHHDLFWAMERYVLLLNTDYLRKKD